MPSSLHEDPDLPGGGDALRVVAVNAERIDLHIDPTAVDALDPLFGRHRDRPSRDGLRVLQHGPLVLAAEQLALVGVCPVRERFEGDAESLSGRLSFSGRAPRRAQGTKITPPEGLFEHCRQGRGTPLHAGPYGCKGRRGA